jgi:peroxiredoxin
MRRSHHGGENIMIEVGKEAPDFELASHLGGTKFTLGQFKNKKNVMLVFYPLDWTPT